MHLIHNLKKHKRQLLNWIPAKECWGEPSASWRGLYWCDTGEDHITRQAVDRASDFVFQSMWFEIFYRRPRVWEEIRNTHRELFSPRYMMSSSLTPWSKWWSTPCLPLHCSRLKAKSGECRSNKNSYFLICHQVVGIQQGIGLVIIFRYASIPWIHIGESVSQWVNE